MHKSKKSIFLIFIIISTIFSSCNSEKTIKENSKEIVINFFANLNLDNYDLMYKSYPNFRKVKEYWKIDDLKIKSAIINEDNTVSVIGVSNIGNILMILKEIDGNYIIIDSKGISSMFNSNIYKYCKNIGCISENDYDKEISQKCINKEIEFSVIVSKIKHKIESNFNLENNNLTNEYGRLSGYVTMKNNSRFTITGRDYEIYYHFLNSDGNVVFTKKEILNFEPIQYDQSITRDLFISNSDGFDKINIELKILSTEFIENIVSENIEGENCNVTNDL